MEMTFKPDPNKQAVDFLFSEEEQTCSSPTRQGCISDNWLLAGNKSRQIIQWTWLGIPFSEKGGQTTNSFLLAISQ